MKMSELKNKTNEELLEILKEVKTVIRTERFKDKFGRKPNIIRSSKLKVARVLTELKNRQMFNKG